MKKSPKESFLNQVQEYNDFIIQNNLDVDMIDPNHDYDFSAFTSLEDWAVESDRLADRLSDRKIEIKQNEDNDEFQGLELENGMPSYEAVKSMSPEQYAEYESKYLTPSKIEDEPVAPAEADVNTTVPSIVTPPDTNKTVPLDLNSSVDSPDPAKVEKDPEYEFSLPLGWEFIKGTHPGIKNAVDAVNSVGKVIDQGQPVNALQDAGRGVMSGLADTAGSIADLGGLTHNAVADAAHESADWWKDQYEIVDNEAGNIGKNVGSEAVAGAAGGVVGKVAGKLYQGMKHGGEALKKRATNAAKDVEKRAELYGKTPLEAAIAKQASYENMTAVPPRHGYTKAIFGNVQPIAGSARIDPIPYGHPMNEKDLLTKVLREKNHLDGKYGDSRGMSGTDLIDPTGRGNLEDPTPARIFDAALHNAKRKIDDRAMLKRNNAEIEQMFNQGKTLDDALKIRQQRWDMIPNTARDAGVVMGGGVDQ